MELNTDMHSNKTLRQGISRSIFVTRCYAFLTDVITGETLMNELLKNISNKYIQKQQVLLSYLFFIHTRREYFLQVGDL